MDTMLSVIKNKGKRMCHINMKVDLSEFYKALDRMFTALSLNPSAEIPDVNYLTSDLLITTGLDKATTSVAAGDNLNKFISDTETHGQSKVN